MSKNFSNTDDYAATPDQIWAMISEKAYWEGKYSELGASNIAWSTFDAAADKLTVSSTREVDANVPAVAKKIIGEKAVVTQTEKWRKAAGNLECNIEITTKGAPGGTNGTMIVKSSGSGSAWSADLEIKVSIPLLGKKLEGMMLEETEANFKKEKIYNDQWISKH